MPNIRIVKTKGADAVEVHEVEKVQVYGDGLLFFQGKNSGPSFYLSPDLVQEIWELKPKGPATAKPKG
jgi:hypothetical protein